MFVRAVLKFLILPVVLFVLTIYVSFFPGKVPTPVQAESSMLLSETYHNSLTTSTGVTFTVQISTALSVVVGRETRFTAIVTPPAENAIYTWEFGDGMTGDGDSVTHTYSSTGPSFRVMVRVNIDGVSKEAFVFTFW
ncbi:PKD domain-containing protein [Chloroflexi bacterium TSY]|nr:PKD domain-containing protein [Chloroflexi bacterium TSY]